jgi:hypothetical protein
MLPLGKNLPRIALADAMIIKLIAKIGVVALWNCFSEASVQKAQNKPSTQLIKATNHVKEWHTKIVEEEHAYILRYQMLSED